MFTTDYQEYATITSYLEHESSPSWDYSGSIERLEYINRNLLNATGRLLEVLYRKGVIDIKELNVIVENQNTNLKEI